MKRLVSGLLLLYGLLVTCQLQADDISDHIKNYILDHLPKYEIFTGRLKLSWKDSFSAEMPWFISLDINGDNRVDWVGFLAKDIEPNSYLYKTHIQELDLFCICSTSNGFMHVLLLDSAGAVAKDNSVSAGIYKKQPGLYVSLVDGQENQLITFASAEYTDFEKSRRIFYWDGDSFEQFWTAD